MIRRWLRLRADNDRLERLAFSRARQIDLLRGTVAEATGRNARTAQRQAVLMSALAEHIARQAPTSTLHEVIVKAGFGPDLAYAMRRLPDAETAAGAGGGKRS
ncbi:hypothetical protein VSR01_16605 [Actinacidiphila sp. DG2A-62]|uniref:hypothetical protein n=1 Tax=Actinacidiphila sp. DG2A-62 TaxID=3108821 RepID=UPI002DBA8F77|nr:hypothetical protein [Actinacidiphila sp. DG2A-62]MEC3995068.1 hypothetical protein [Actinacidiphila sp. DG2A-62]